MTKSGPLAAAAAALSFCLVLAAGEARAWAPDAKAVATAASGKVWLQVTPDPQGAPALARGVIDIAAPPAVVWKLMVDCAATRRIMPSNRGCRVLEKDAKGRWDVREHIMKTPIMPALRAVFRSEVELHKRLVFKRVEGDMKVLEGEWRLESLDGGARTRVIHEMRMQPGFSAPGALVRSFIRGEVSTGLANLRRESEAAAKS